jgi:hypothetical protein
MRPVSGPEGAGSIAQIGVTAGSAVIVDDFHCAVAAVSGHMTDLVQRWPTGTAQLVLAGRADPPLRRLRPDWGERCSHLAWIHRGNAALARRGKPESAP